MGLEWRCCCLLLFDGGLGIFCCVVFTCWLLGSMPGCLVVLLDCYVCFTASDLCCWWVLGLLAIHCRFLDYWRWYVMY